jgi:hypothetical protein
MKLYVNFRLFFVFNLIFFLKLASTHSYSKKMNPNGIFSNNELDLQKIKVYGFDFGLSFYLLKRQNYIFIFLYRLYISTL